MPAFTPTDQRVARDTLRTALLDIALKWGEGVDRKGKPYTWMWDCRELLLSQQYLRLSARLIWERLKPYRPEMVGGMTMAANPLTIALLYEAHEDGYPLDGFLIRKEPKSDGLQKLIEGPPIRKGTRIVLVDDLVNSGETQRQALKALEPTGADVLAIGTLLNIQRGGDNWIAAQGIALEALFTMTELGMAPQVPHCPGAWQPTWTYGPLNRPEYPAPKSTPVFTPEGIVVGADRGFVVALDHEGRERWRYVVRDRERGVHGTPAVHGDRVYFGAYDGFLYCLNALTGELVWESRPAQWIGSSPLVDAERGCLYVGIEFGEAGGSVLAVDLDSGDVRWAHRAQHYVHATPVLDSVRGQVLVGANDSLLYALDVDSGALRWSFATSGEIKAAVALDDDGRCFVSSFDGWLYALDASTGMLLWRRRLGRQLYSTPLVLGDQVVVGSYSGRVLALSRDTGAVRWVCTTGARIVGGAIALDANRLAIASADGKLYVLDARTGEPEDVFAARGPNLGTPAFNAGRLAFASIDGKLYALERR